MPNERDSGVPWSGQDMQRVNDFWFYQLGYHIHGLVQSKPSGPIREVLPQLNRAATWLDAFMDGSEIFPFKVSLNAAGELRRVIAEIAAEPDRDITPYESGRLTRLVRDFETVVAAEVGTFSTYSVTKKLAYDTRTLIEEGSALLPADMRLKVPAETLEDLDQATKCMAFEVNTACGLHTIRATEAVIRAYYAEVVGTAPGTKDRNWGAYIRTLRAKGADPRVTGFLDHIRESYRNPIAHPDQRLDAEEAQVLMGVCVSAIIQMVGAIDGLRALTVVTAAAAVAR